jgi:phage nucleotide-binding protein
MATAILPSSSTKRRKPSTDVAEKIIPASAAKGPLKMVVYGRNKQGKTHFAGSSELKTLIIDCNEKGQETLADRENVDVYHLDSWKEENDLYWWIKTAKHDYEVIAIDTVSSLSNRCMKFVMKEAEHDSGVDPAMPQRQHWGKAGTLMSDFLTDWRNLPYHIIFLAQERKWVEEDDSGDGEGVLIEVTPSLSKAPLQTLLSVVGTIGRIYVRETEVKGKKVFEHRMLLGPHEMYSGGTRIKGLPRVMREPTLQKILDIRDKKGEHKPGRATHGLEI